MPVVSGIFGGRGVVDRGRIGPPGGKLVDARVGDRGKDHPVLGRELGQHRQQPLVESARVEVGQQHDQRATPGSAEDRGNHCSSVGFDQRRLQRSHCVDQPGQQFGSRHAEYAGPGHPVVRQEVDVVTSSRGESRQQQSGVHRPIQPGPTGWIDGRRIDTDPAGSRAPGIEHDDDPPITFGSPGPHHDVGSTGGGAPVDRADVVTDDILSQRVEFGALPPRQGWQQAVDLPEFSQARG